jgi:hypothetical protein
MSAVQVVMRKCVRSGERILGLKDVVIRPVFSEADWNAVYRMTHDNYVALGYCKPQPDGRLIHYPQFDHVPETQVLLAEVNGQIVGTCSVTIDGPNGLPVEDDFKEECDGFRAQGRKLADCWRFITLPEYHRSPKVAIGLMREMFNHLMKTSAMNTLVMAAVPKHGRAYARVLNATLVTYRRQIGAVNGTDAVLMRCDKETCAWATEPALAQAV